MARPFSTRRARIFGIVAATLTEGLGVYLWLRLDDAGETVLAYVALLVGEVLETAAIAVPLRRGETLIPDGDPFGVARHRRRFQQRFGAASILELLIWAAWLELATEWSQVAGAALLLVLMHLKHQLEATTVRDIPFSRDFWKETVSSAAETAGAVACLWLILEDEPALAAVALAAGFLLEHTILLGRLYAELAERDISRPRHTHPPRTVRLRLLRIVAKRMPRVWRALQSWPPLDRFLNALAIQGLVTQVPARPNPFSTRRNYTSWETLTDREWSARHLGPSDADGHPPADAVAALFTRGDEMVPCPKSTVLFASFAQWFVDGFLRTEREQPGIPRNTLRNESTHDIDLAQLYGTSEAVTNALRTLDGGMLRTHQPGDDDEPYPEYLCENGDVRPEFAALPKPLGFDAMTPDQKNRLFAMGTDPISLGFLAMNTLFLREHNRIATELRDEYGWDNDDQLFETTRSILIVVLIRIVIEDYINHITGYHFQFSLPRPGTFRKAAWFRQNWMAVEFDLLYRWHPLMPGSLEVGEEQVPLAESLGRTDVLKAHGLRTVMLSASQQRAGRISLFNTDPFLVANAEIPTVEQGRTAQLQAFNEYRAFSRFPRVPDFSHFSSDPRVGTGLKELYGQADNVEFFTGLFAEELDRFDMLPPLMTAMVAFDAFSQVITNPLLAPRVYGSQTFTELGMQIIADTPDLATLIRRNAAGATDADYFSLTWQGYRGA